MNSARQVLGRFRTAIHGLRDRLRLHVASLTTKVRAPISPPYGNLRSPQDFPGMTRRGG